MSETKTGIRPSLDHQFDSIRDHPALQQPEWCDISARSRAISDLENSDGIVSEVEVVDFRRQLREVAAGRALVLQAGDCAEPITDTTREIVERKALALDAMGEVLEDSTALPVVRIGRIAGQFAKPRSKSHETVDGTSVPTYRGALVNAQYPSLWARTHQPDRLVRAHAAARSIGAHLRRRTGRTIWTSHEALVLDYEVPQMRRASNGRGLLTSAHTVWVGARTNQPDHAHIALLAEIDNPVGCKVSSTTEVGDLLAIADAVNPGREEGKLMLIARMGDEVDKLPELMDAMASNEHPIIWLCDPMHGNTVTAADGRKARYLAAITKELIAFQDAATSVGVIPGGIHLETTIDDVRECLTDGEDVRHESEPFTSLCDPRLTIAQAVDVLSHWKGAART